MTDIVAPIEWGALQPTREPRRAFRWVACGWCGGSGLTPTIRREAGVCAACGGRGEEREWYWES